MGSGGSTRGIMEVIARHLAPEGVAYVSYNTYPGWSVLQTVREALLMRTRGIADARRRAATARNLLDFLAVAEGDYTCLPRTSGQDGGAILQGKD